MYEDLIKRLRTHNGWALNKTLDEAADAIKELQDRIAASEATIKRQSNIIQVKDRDLQRAIDAKSQWIPVTERLPKEDETVMTWGKQEVVLLDWLHDNRWCCFGEVIYWMPLPEPPKEGE